MDRKTLIAITLCFVIFLGWQKFVIEPRMPKKAAEQAQVDATGAGAITSAGQASARVDAKMSVSPANGAKSKIGSTRWDKPATETFNVKGGQVSLSNGPRVVSGWKLDAFKDVDLQSVVLMGDAASYQVEIAFDRSEFAYLTGVQGALELDRASGKATWNFEDDKIKLVRRMTIRPDGEAMDIVFEGEFKSVAPKFAFLSLFGKNTKDDPESQDRNVVYWSQKSHERVHIEESMKLKELAAPTQWIGITNRYFLMALLAQGQDAEQVRGLIQPLDAWSARASLVYPVSGDKFSIPVKAFFGPKELNTLRSIEGTLDHTVDFGFFTFVAYPLLQLMKWLYGIMQNYGLAIIVLTLIVKLLTYPLTYKSMKSMKQMQKLQPQLAKIKEKYANDKEALNREMLTVMRTHGYNPMAGCLPILVQMPVFFALYRVLYSSIELYQAPFAFWIHDLSAKDPFYVTPVLLTVTMFVQQKLTPNTATDPMQQKMMQFMPVIFGVFMISLPSGLTLYMLVNALASILQQLILNRKLDIGNAQPVAAASRAR